MDILGWLQYFGITPDKLTPLIVSGAIGGACLVVYFNKQLNKHLNPIKATVIKIRDAVIEMQTILKGYGASLTYNLLETTGSPLRPTKIGTELIKESGLEEILNDHKEFLAKKLKEKLPKDYTSYDIQENARELLVELIDESIMNPVKNYSYQKGILAERILEVGGLWLRDDFLGHPRQFAKEECE